jgi:hypothetical protein
MQLLPFLLLDAAPGAQHSRGTTKILPQRRSLALAQLGGGHTDRLLPQRVPLEDDDPAATNPLEDDDPTAAAAAAADDEDEDGEDLFPRLF